MATTISLLEANPLKWKQSFPVQLFPHSTPHISRTFIQPPKFCSILHLKTSPRYNCVKCFFSQKPSVQLGSEPLDEHKSKPPLEVVANSILNALKALRKPAIAAVLLGLLLMYDPNSALAASGGRMGGRSFSSHSSSSSSSRSYSVPRTSSPGFSYSVPYYAPSPFGFGGGGGGIYVGPAVGFGVGAGSSFLLILMGFAAFILVSGFLSDRSEGSVLTAAEKTTVLKLQVR